MVGFFVGWNFIRSHRKWNTDKKRRSFSKTDLR